MVALAKSSRFKTLLHLALEWKKASKSLPIDKIQDKFLPRDLSIDKKDKSG
jgi:hypothetical protein